MKDERKKAVLFICECGKNIADFMDLNLLAGWAKENSDFEAVEMHKLLCAPDGKKFFEETLNSKKPERVIIAACSPKMHEKTFQDVAEKLGINMSRIHMANIREHCAWVTKNREDALEKAKHLINAADKRSVFVEDLEHRSLECMTDILVVGGGIAGIEAALAGARAGRKVYLVDKEPSIGGNVIKSEEVAPNMECSPCLLAPVLSAVKDDPNIEVITNAEVTDILGFFGNFTAKIRKKARFVEDSCIGCEACFEVCPVSVKSDFHLGLGERKAVYTQFPGSVPAAAVIDRDNCKQFIDGSCDACVAACPFESINFKQEDEDIEVKIGAVVLATGFQDWNPSSFPELGYGKIENVYTISEFERMASSNGPSGGTIKLRNGKSPESVAVIHCVGSLRDDAIPYCSGVCCTTASKVGELVRKQYPDAKVFNLHNDLVFPSPKEHAFYKHQVQEGTNFIKCNNLKAVKISSNEDKIKVITDGIDSLNVDMVVLATGMMPADSNALFSEMLHLERDKNGFFKTDHELLHATGSSLDGIYLAGCTAGPCNVATAATRGHAAVGDALSKLIPGRKIELEVLTSVIDEEKCGGCKLCIQVCPYKAVIFDKEKNISVVNEAICRGCGTCTASCPSGASRARHFTDEQIYAEIGGLLHD